MSRLVGPAEPVREVEVQLARTVDRLRSLSLDRLGRPAGDGPSPADRAHALSRYFVNLAYRAGRTGDGLSTGDAPPALPRLGDHAAGDQLQVLVREYLIVAATRADSPESRAELDDARRRLLELRRLT